MIKIAIADDHKMFINGIRSLLEGNEEIRIVAEALNGKELLKTLEGLPIDVVLLDINIPGIDGVSVLEVIKKEYTNTRILALITHNESQFINQIMHSGIDGYLLKNSDQSELISSIKAVCDERNDYKQAATEPVRQKLQEEPIKQNEVQLTEGETDVLRLIAKDHSTQEIADKLFISTQTVETHRKNLLNKLKTRSSIGLVKYAIESGLLNTKKRP